MATKKLFIRSSQDLITRELEKLQNKVSFLEASTADKVSKKKIMKKTAVYSPPMEVEAKTVEFEMDDEMFDIRKP